MREVGFIGRRGFWSMAMVLPLFGAAAMQSSRAAEGDGPSWDYPEVTWFEWDTWRWHEVVDDKDWEDVDDDGTAEYVGRAEDDDLQELAEHIGADEDHDEDADASARRSVWPRWDDASRDGWSDQDYDPAPADADSVGANDPVVIPGASDPDGIDEWNDIDWAVRLED